MLSDSIGRIPPFAQAPIIHCNGPAADLAWSEYSALARALRDAPSLANNHDFISIKDAAYKRFYGAFQVLP